MAIDAAGPSASATRSCADCGTVAPDRYCPACGQITSLDRTIGAMLHSLVHDVAHIDGKLWRTLPLLVFKPGILTRRYIEGQRTRYVGPNVIFLSSAFFMFLAFNLLPGPEAHPACDLTEASALQRTGKTVRENLQEIGPGVEAVLPAPSPSGAAPSVVWLERHAPPGIIAQLNASLSNPEKLLMKVKQKAYKMGFLLVPLSLPALWLLVGRRRNVRLYDLTVFALYSIGFMSFLLMFIMLLAGIGLFAWPLYVALLLTVPPAHFYLHLRDSFTLSPAEAIWRTAALCFAATISLIFYLIIVLAWNLFL